MDEWSHAQEEEKAFWNTCQNTLGEELKQLVYARYMGLSFYHDGNTPYNIDLQGKWVIDIGGGPSSLLLKAKNAGRLVVADPCDYPQWVKDRYKAAGISFYDMTGENIDLDMRADEVWIYNVLSHTFDPEMIIRNALTIGKTLRIFEWVDERTNHAHPIRLTKENLDKWIGHEGYVIQLNENGCVGNGYFQTFAR